MKCFLSLLGTGKYNVCVYSWPDGRSPAVTYVQTASLLRTGRVDRVVIFCTEKAKTTHWEGLCKEFSKSGLSEPSCVDIADGLDERGMWSVFESVIEQVPEGTEIIFDATHSYRSLSLILSIVLNYLRVVRGTALDACYYGAFEARTNDVAPLVDLKPFFELNDWTIAVRDFAKLGNAAELAELAKRTVLPGLKEGDQEARDIRDMMNWAKAFTDNVLVNRLGNVDRGDTIVGSEYGRILEKYQTVKRGSMLPPPMKPILERVVETFQNIQRDDGHAAELRKGMAAAKWACEHELIPQGYTLLLETIIGCVSGQLDFSECESMSRIEKREEASRLLNGHMPKFACLKSQFDDKFGSTQLRELFRNFCAYRNNINHAGTGHDNPPLLKVFREKLQNFMNAFAGVFQEG